MQELNTIGLCVFKFFFFAYKILNTKTIHIIYIRIATTNVSLQ